MTTDTSETINKLKMKFQHEFGMPSGIVDVMMDLCHLSILKEFQEQKIKFCYLNNEFGVEARKLHNDIGTLNRAYNGDAGIDLPIVLLPEDRKHGDGIDIWPGEREMLHTGIQMEFPIGYYARIVHRSSTEKKHRLRVIEGIIDDYRGEILVQVHNPNSCQVRVHHGDRLGQMILARTCPFSIEEAKELRPSQRGARGFGSSGK